MLKACGIMGCAMPRPGQKTFNFPIPLAQRFDALMADLNARLPRDERKLRPSVIGTAAMIYFLEATDDVKLTLLQRARGYSYELLRENTQPIGAAAELENAAARAEQGRADKKPKRRMASGQ